MDVVNGILLCWSVFSFILYVAVLYVLIKNRHSEPFNAHFFSLFTSLGFADLMAVVHLYGYALFRYWGWLDFDRLFTNETVGWFARAWAYAFIHFITFVQFFGVLWMAVNRFLNITNLHVEIWDDRVHRWALCAQWLIPLLFGFVPWLTQDFVAVSIVVGENTTDRYTFMSVLSVDLDFDAMYKTVFYGIGWNAIAVVITCLYGKCFWHVRKVKKEINALTAADKRNIKLAVVGVILFVFMSEMNACSLLHGLIRSPSLRELMSLLYYIGHVMFSLANPLLLLICSKPTRNKFKQTFAATILVHPTE